MDVNGILSCAIGKVLSTNNLNRSGKQWCYGPRHARDRRFCPCRKSIITVPPVRLAYGELLVLLFLRHLGFRRQLPSQGWILHNALNILKRFPKLRKKTHSDKLVSCSFRIGQPETFRFLYSILATGHGYPSMINASQPTFGRRKVSTDRRYLQPDLRLLWLSLSRLYQRADSKMENATEIEQSWRTKGGTLGDQQWSVWYGPRFACKSRDRQRYEIGDDRRIFTTARFHQ